MIQMGIGKSFTLPWELVLSALWFKEVYKDTNIYIYICKCSKKFWKILLEIMDDNKNWIKMILKIWSWYYQFLYARNLILFLTPSGNKLLSLKSTCNTLSPILSLQSRLSSSFPYLMPLDFWLLSDIHSYPSQIHFLWLTKQHFLMTNVLIPLIIIFF